MLRPHRQRSRLRPLGCAVVGPSSLKLPFSSKLHRTGPEGRQGPTVQVFASQRYIVISRRGKKGPEFNAALFHLPCRLAWFDPIFQMRLDALRTITNQASTLFFCTVSLKSVISGGVAYLHGIPQ